MIVGVLEPGHENGGLRLYGEAVAGGLGGLEGVEVREIRLTAARPGRAGLRDAWAIVSAMRSVDVAIIPYARFHTWSPSASKLLQLALIHLGLRRRTLTVVHDVYVPGWPQRLEWWAITLNTLLSGAVVVHSEQDRRNLRRALGSSRIQVIPHFVLERRLPDRAHARTLLGVAEGRTIATMIGWLNPRKNYELAIEALALLPESVELWLVGDADEELSWYRRELEALAGERGVAERLRITGAVSEDELELHLAATDIGLCPYRRISASGSVSTLLGARRPVIVTDVPFARELHEYAPEVVHLLEAMDAATVARAVARHATAQSSSGSYQSILNARSIPATALRYRERLVRVVGGS